MSPRTAKKTGKASSKAKQPLKQKTEVQMQSTPQEKPKRVSPMSNIYVVIDHPRQNEIISGSYYTIRIGASDNFPVEISINDSQWQPCRSNSGFWWYDWSQFAPGNNRICARVRNDKGRTIKKSTVECKVI